MVIRTFFDKDNVIVYNDLVNTGKNEIAELFYGGPIGNETYSRFIFHFNEERLRELYNNQTFCDLTKLKHTLRITNTGAFDTNLLCNNTCDGKHRTCSFDLILFPLTQEWDEGNGYDYQSCNYLVGNSCNDTSSYCASNWVYAQTNVNWSGGNGTYTGSSNNVMIATQHFEHGNEDVEIDITDYVNGIITGNTNYGLGLAFPTTLESLSTDEIQYVGFFTRHTQTFFEPFLETIYDNPIMDDRNNFYLDKVNKLYLYSNIGGEPTPLDNPPVVTITDPFGSVFSSMTASCVTRGVYCVELFIPSYSGYSDCMTFEDTWSNISINGITRPNIELEFIVKDSSKYYNIGQNDELPKKYGLRVTGIKANEKIKRGDIRRLNVSARIPYTVNQSELIDNLQYRLYVNEGRNQYTVIDWQDVNRGFNSNYFLLDTESLIPNTYYLDLKVESQNEVTTHTEVLKFEIISQSELRNS